MEAKKNPQADLRRFAGLFFEIGLVVAFCAVLGAFSYTVQEKKLADFGSLADVIDDMDLIPVTRPTTVTPPPPAAPKVAEIINIVEDEADLDDELEIEDVDADQDTKIVLIDRQEDAEVEDDDLPFPMAEVMPQFPGGDAALQKYLASHIQYPEIARENGLQGKVYVRFVINRRGEVEDVSIARGVDAALDKEAMRAITSMPKWEPGTQGGEKVRVRFTLPITFRLQ